MKERLDKWREASGKAPETIALKKKLTAKGQDLQDYQASEKEYWNLELENESLKRKSKCNL